MVESLYLRRRVLIGSKKGEKEQGRQREDRVFFLVSGSSKKKVSLKRRDPRVCLVVSFIFFSFLVRFGLDDGK